MITVVRDRFAFDQLHRKERKSIFRCAAVEQASDIRMLQTGKNLAFIFEASDYETRILAGPDDLQGNLFSVLIVGTGMLDRLPPSLPRRGICSTDLISTNAPANP